MSDDYKLQLSSTVNGNLVNVRAQSAEELQELVEGLAKTVDGVFTAFAQFKDGVVAKDIFTGNAGVGGGLGGAKGASSTGSGRSVSANGVPECQHGPMLDLRSKNYKSDYYCSHKDRDNQCKPVKL